MTNTLSPDLATLFANAEAHRACAIAQNDSQERKLQRAVVAGAVVSPLRGIFARTSYWESLKPNVQALHEMRALQALHPSWVFAGSSAALAYGLAVSYDDTRTLTVAYQHGHHVRSREHVRRMLVERDRPWTCGDLQVTSPERTVLDCLRSMDFPRGLAIADSALGTFRLSRTELVDRLRAIGRRHRGIAQAIETASWADARAANGGESVARAIMIELGYVVPDLQREIPNLIEGGVYYADYFWELPLGIQVAGELDGGDKYIDPAMTRGRDPLSVVREERLRESRVSARGIRVMRFAYRDVLNRKRFARLLDAYEIPKR